MKTAPKISISESRNAVLVWNYYGFVFAGFVLLLFFSVLTSMALGEAMLPPSEIWAVLCGAADESSRIIFFDIRLPRTIVGLFVGAGLGASGVVMQAYFRNSLAAPGLLGVSSGGALGAVLALTFGGWLGIYTVPLASVSGAFMAIGAVMLLARKGASPEHLLLAGVALNALFGAATSFILSASADQTHLNAQILFWLMGGIENRTWEHVWMAAPSILLASVLLLPLGRPMNLLALGDSGAQSLGVDVRRLRWQLIVLSTILTALATAVAGVIGFVGLVVPHIIRLIDGPNHRRLLPLSMLGGASLVLLCDLPTRFLGAGMRLGVITSLAGGPFLLWLLRKRPC
ncbi:MAG: iron ABC transporter permease [Holophagales bacterium]|nr:iron ABC transporter permease [Holophagales bacterium]